MTLEELIAQRSGLLAARFRGVRTVEMEGRRVTFATNAEMAAAITDLERRFAAGIVKLFLLDQPLPKTAAANAEFSRRLRKDSE